MDEDRAGFVERLRARQPELEAAIFERVRAVSGSEIEHAEYQLDRLIAQVGHEYRLQRHLTERSPERRRAELAQRLLAGTPVDVGELGYELDAWHLCVIATGANATQAVRGLATALGRDLLLIARDREVWAWLGGQRKLMIADLERVLLEQGPAGVSLAVGEAARGIDGWRLTHREAQAAHLVARYRAPRKLTRYLDVALDATALQDDALADSLIERYLSPLDGMRIGGQAARRTLRALFDTEHNLSSAAAGIKVDRSTVRRWRGEIEEQLGCRLHERRAEIEVALRLEDLRAHAGAEGTPAERHVG